MKESMLILVAKIPKPKDEAGEQTEASKSATTELPLPQTLVRIPTEQAPLLEQAVNGSEGQ
jgi:DASH complex subunit DAD2